MRQPKHPAFMGKGTTPRFRFRFIYEENEVSGICITFKGLKSGCTVEKNKSAIHFADDGCIETTLAEEETRAFLEDEKIMMSIRTKLTDGRVPYSPPMYTYMGKVLREQDEEEEQ